jgi:hypothetical protein
MMLSPRFLAALLAVLWTAGAASAQVEVAPAPHPTLEHIAKDYERYKLPLPKPNWRLVETRIGSLAFRSPENRGENQFSGIYASHEDEPGTPLDAAEVAKRLKNDAKYLGEVSQRDQLTCLAVQCRHHGLKELADALYSRSVGFHRLPYPELSLGKFGTFPGGPPEAVEIGLRNNAFAHWTGQITERGRDRRPALEALRVVAPDHPDTRDLELTLKPSTAARGSIEALIDQLVEYEIDIGFEDRCEFSAVIRLAEFGFDAVPALIEHWNDRRFTRQLIGIGPVVYNPLGFGPYREVRVGDVWDVCKWILNSLLGFPDYDGDAGKALKAYGRARLVGEERWLAERASKDFQNRDVLRALGSRFPERLAPIYQTVLLKDPVVDSGLLAELIGASRLPRAEKVKLLEEGARHREIRHRVPAVGALKAADDRVFRKHLLAGLKAIEPDESDDDGEYVPRRRFAELMPLTDDRECWDEFFAASKRVPSQRYFHVAHARRMDGPEPSNAPRYETLRFLMRFLTDDTRSDDYSIGDLAAWQIFAMTDIPHSEFPERHSPFFSLLYRARATIAAEREMDKFRKP